MHRFSGVQSLFSEYFAIHLEIKVQVAREVELKQKVYLIICSGMSHLEPKRSHANSIIKM